MGGAACSPAGGCGHTGQCAALVWALSGGSGALQRVCLGLGCCFGGGKEKEREKGERKWLAELGCSSLVEHLSSVIEDWGSSSALSKERRKSKRKENQG